ncbi:MAG: hypothetical protein LBF34_03000 [Puniceicoccales bacterium]|nr:hypothetical protein [Puniceicoccales bacterium]
MEQYDSLEHSNVYQNRAEELIKKGDATNAFPLLDAAEREQNTPAGREAWQALGDEGQANWHKVMADLYRQLNQLGDRVGPHHHHQNGAKIKHHTTQAEWARRGPNRRSQDCQTLAQQSLGKQSKALAWLQKASGQWNTPAGQEAWQILGDTGQASWHDKMAELYTQLRKPDLAREHTEQAEWVRKGPIGRATSHQLEAKEAITNGNPQDAIPHLNQAAEQWESREGQEAWDRLGTEKRANGVFF